MERKKIKLFFTDFWKGFNPETNFFIKRIQLYFEVEIDELYPDYLFYSWNGSKHLKYKDAVKIYFTGENDVPDFNICDYAIGFHPITFNDRYFRLPLYVIYDCFYKLNKSDTRQKNDKQLLERKFCSFVVSNSRAADPIRDHFFNELNKYKKIDSGGRYLNNIGYFVPDKYEFIRNYKFNLAFENSTAPGYTTEKLVEPLTENTIPIYWGNPEVDKDFNKKAFICINDFNTIQEAIEEIIRIDNDDEAYMKMINESPFKIGQKQPEKWLEDFDNYLSNIFIQHKDIARRITQYGYSRFYRNRNHIFSKFNTLPGIKYIIRKFAYKW